MIKAIFFDTSDTLYSNKDFEAAQAAQPIYQLAELKGLSFSEAKALFDGKKLELKGQLEHVTKVAVMMELGVSRLEMQAYMAGIDAHDFLNPDDELLDMLNGLSTRHSLGIISNILESAVKNVLEALGVERAMFNHFVTVSNTTNSKPNLEPFQKAIELSKLMPAEILYVGDSLNKDIIPAKKAGMKTVWITRKKEFYEQVDQTIEEIYQLPEVIKFLN